MSPSRRSKKPAGRRGGAPNQAADLWRSVPAPDAPEPIVTISDASALLVSLGSPPLQGHASVAEHYLAAVVERAAGIATALALSADLLATDDQV